MSKKKWAVLIVNSDLKKNNLYIREALNQNIMTIFKPKLI